MEYIAKIVEGHQSKSKQFWRYTFVDTQTDEEDWFINNYRISHIPSLAGKLKLDWDKNGNYKLYQDFQQNEEFEEEEGIDWWEEELSKGTKKVDDKLTRRPIKFKHQDLVEFVEGLKKAGVSYKEIAKGLKRSVRMVRYWRKPVVKPLQKVGAKRRFDRKCLFHLLFSIQNKKVKTQQEMSDYVFSKTGKRFCVATISLILRKIKYSYQTVPYRHPQQKQNLAEVVEFMERVNKLPARQLLSTDESGFPLNLALRRGWGLKGQKIADFKPSYGVNYSLLLIIQNTEKGGIIHWDLVKDTVNTEVFANFLSRVELPDEEMYYLLLDNIRFHHAKKIKELLTSKNVEPRYIVASNPYLNPVEEIFNIIKQYVRKQKPRTYEELKSAVSKIINILQNEDMTKYFKNCLDFDFVWNDVKSFSKGEINY